jgi:hypothetical protein
LTSVVRIFNEPRSNPSNFYLAANISLNARSNEAGPIACFTVPPNCNGGRSHAIDENQQFRKYPPQSNSGIHAFGYDLLSDMNFLQTCLSMIGQ